MNAIAWIWVGLALMFALAVVAAIKVDSPELRRVILTLAVVMWLGGLFATAFFAMPVGEPMITTAVH